MKRTPRTERKLRRALERESLTSQAVKRLQGQRIAQWAKQDAERIAEQVKHVGIPVRTLRYDEQAKAHTAPSAAALVVDAAKWNEHTAIEEHRDDYLIPRQARTVQLCLRLFKPVMEFRDEPFRQLDAESRDKLAHIAKDIRRAHPDNREAYARKLMEGVTLTYVAGTNPRLAWKSDTTLLSTKKGADTLEHIAFKRIGSNNKERKIEKESADVTDVYTPTPG